MGIADHLLAADLGSKDPAFGCHFSKRLTSASSATMTQTAKQWSPKAKARLAGVFEALEGFTSSWGQVTVLGKLLVAGHATSTAANILQHQTLFLYAFISSLSFSSF